MKPIAEVPLASKDGDACAEPDTEKGKLALSLEARGLRPIGVGRALVVLQRCETQSDAPAEAGPDWGTLSLTIFGDPDTSPYSEPERLFVSGTRFGLGKIVLESRRSGRLRIFEFEPKLVRDEEIKSEA